MIDYKVVKITKKDYPKKLKIIKDVPEQIYVIGNIDLLHKDSFGIIGTRNISEYGKKNCNFFASEIALRDIPIVSGMAIGTDTIAHETALECDSETIAVLGGGFNHVYPNENKPLFEDIIKNNGLVITEYDLNELSNSCNFPKRNRIVSALCDGILVVEAMARSGTSITVRYAKQYGKKVFALPGRLDNCYGVGVNRMIKQGAILVTDIEDIIKEFPQFANKKRKTILENKIKFIKVKEEYKDIVRILENDILSVEEIYYRLNNNSIQETVKLLVNMELEGIIIQKIGEGYGIL